MITIQPSSQTVHDVSNILKLLGERARETSILKYLKSSTPSINFAHIKESVRRVIQMLQMAELEQTLRQRVDDNKNLKTKGEAEKELRKLITQNEDTVEAWQGFDTWLRNIIKFNSSKQTRVSNVR